MGHPDTMSTDPAAAPAPKRARVPYRPPLRSLWAQNDLADSVVAFLPGTNLSKLPVISKSFRAAQPLVLFTAARRLKVLDRAQGAFLDVLREVTPDRRWFREKWTGGLDRWQMDDGEGTRADIVGSPPQLRLRGCHGGDHRGISHRFYRSAGRSLTVKSLRAQVTFPDGVSCASGYVWLVTPGSHLNAIGGFYGKIRGEGGEGFSEAVDPADRVGVLTWVARQEYAEGKYKNRCTELCTVTPGVCYEVSASFSDADDDGFMITTVTVTPRGQPPSIVCCIGGRAGVLDAVRIYNFQDCEAYIGDVEVGYESEDDEDDESDDESDEEDDESEDA